MVGDFGALLALSGALVSGGAAWGGAKSALNGTRKRVEEIRDGLAEHIKADAALQLDMVQRLARIEAKLDQSVKQ